MKPLRVLMATVLSASALGDGPDGGGRRVHACDQLGLPARRDGRRQRLCVVLPARQGARRRRPDCVCRCRTRLPTESTRRSTTTEPTGVRIHFWHFGFRRHILRLVVGVRMYVRSMSTEAVREAMANLARGLRRLRRCDVDALTRTEVLSVIDDLETLTCRMPTQWHRLLTRLQAETTPREMGAKSWNEVLRIRWRLSTGEASRRLHEAADLAARTSLTGQPLAPRLPAVAAAQAAGTDHRRARRRDPPRHQTAAVLGRHPHRRAVRGRPGARRGRRRTQRTARHRRPAAVPARSGRPRTRRRRTRPQTPLHHRGSGPRRDDRGDVRTSPPKRGRCGT